AFLAHLERLGTRVVNGFRGFTIETSKALQLSLLESLGLAYPRARVINHPAEAPEAAQGLRFPVVVKANLGGSGAGIVRYDEPAALAAAAARGAIDLGIDSTAPVPEVVPARGGAPLPGAGPGARCGAGSPSTPQGSPPGGPCQPPPGAPPARRPPGPRSRAPPARPPPGRAAPGSGATPRRPP